MLGEHVTACSGVGSASGPDPQAGAPAAGSSSPARGAACRRERRRWRPSPVPWGQVILRRSRMAESDPSRSPFGAPRRHVLGVPPSPSYGIAVVDGEPGEWNLEADFFTNMYRAGNTNKPLESKAYLRYDCTSHTLFVLVLVEPGVAGIHDPQGGSATSWVAIGAVQKNS